ncbi:MAG: gamma-glutamyltransferase, partial [Actinomycetota bacterium]
MERGARGAVAAAHPAAVDAARELFAAGGNAADAAIAAQAALGVVIPNACGVGGDALFLVAERDGTRDAINGTGVWPREATVLADTGGASVTVPGAVEGWATLAEHHGRLGLAAALAPAIRLARAGHAMPASTAEAVADQRERLVAGGAGAWPRLAARAGDVVRDEPLAEVLAAIAQDGPRAFYEGPMARAIAAAVVRCGGAMTQADLAARDVERRAPLATAWDGGLLHVQPPMSQALLLAMAARWFEREGVPDDRALRDHLAVEAIGAAFRHRDRVADGAALLDVELAVDREGVTGYAGP